MKDRHTGKLRGFRFVCFSDPSTVDLVMEEDKHEVNHKIVKRAQARVVAPPSIHEKPSVSSSSSSSCLPHHQQQQEPNGSTNTSEPFLTPEQLHNKVFVGGIPPDVDRDTLRQIEQFGSVQDAVVMLDQVTNRSRRFGFVTFEHGSKGAERSIAAQPVLV